MKPAAAVAVLGGGAYAARLVEVIAALPEFPALELRLHALDAERLATIAEHAAGRVRAAAAPHLVRACPDLDAALDQAAAVVLLVRVGGLAARDHDESFPVRFGLVGDEGLGVGGMANAWRTLPVLEPIAERIAACAPGAQVLNLMAPLGVTTRLLVEHGLAAAGLCELPMATVARWRARAGIDGDGALAYAGLNHLGFFWSPAGPAVDHPVLCAAVDGGEVPAEILARLEAAPLHYFVDLFAPEAALRLGRRRAPGRARELADLQETLLVEFRRRPGAAIAELARRPTPWFELSLVPALHAALGGPACTGALDLPNRGALAEAPAEGIVELEGRLDAGGARFDPTPPRPEPVRSLIGRLAAAEDLLYRASRRRDRALLADALLALPLGWAGDAASGSAGDAVRAELLDCVCRPLSGREVQP